MQLKTCTKTFIIAQTETAQTLKYINKLWYIHIVEYLLAIKRINCCYTAINNLNESHIILSERSQTQETTHYKNMIYKKYMEKKKRSTWADKTNLW